MTGWIENARERESGYIYVCVCGPSSAHFSLLAR